MSDPAVTNYFLQTLRFSDPENISPKYANPGLLILEFL